MKRRKAAAFAVTGLGAMALTLAAWGGTALAVSGGGHNPNQQDCNWNSSNWASPNGYTQSGCHNVAVNVESGGTTNGDANANNTRYVEWGNDQSPNQSGNPSFGGLLAIGDPGTMASPHSGCVAANTDGTNGGTGTGCGYNAQGTGFQATYDYYQVYCPAAALLPSALFGLESNGIPAPYQCAAGQPIGHTNVNPSTGTNQTLTDVLTQGLLVYFGMDDNTDNGEHDGFSGLNNTDGSINGPSDGGSMLLSFTPQSAANTPSAMHPDGLVNYSMGFCADGICGAGTTQQQTVYYGCNPAGNTNTYNGTDGATNPQNNSADAQCAPGTAPSTDAFQNNTPSSTQESYNCNAGNLSTETACYTNADGSPNPGGANTYRQNTPSQVNTEPGVQTYQDPDPQRSPAAPFGTPGTYAGTCGVYANDGGGYGEPGVISTVTGGNVGSQTNPANGQPVDNPGWIVKTDPAC
ncbi:MAG: hypothetical protein ACYDD4_12170 [Acidimicrobiales bacterium]